MENDKIKTNNHEQDKEESFVEEISTEDQLKKNDNVTILEKKQTSSKKFKLQPMSYYFKEYKPQLTLIAVFFFIQCFGVFFAYNVAQSPELQQTLEENRPPMFEESGGKSTMNIVLIGVIGTLILVILKKYLSLNLKLIVMIAVFGAGTIVADIFSSNFLINSLFGITLVVLRERFESLNLLNLTVVIAILGFGAMGQFIEANWAVILMIVLSIYDIIGVLYTKHITYLWFGTYKFDTLWREVLAYIVVVDDTEVIIVGAGDFAFPLLLTFSSTKLFVETSVNAYGILAGFLVAVCTTIGFGALQYYATISEASKETGLPGLPFVSSGGIFGFIISKLMLGIPLL